MLSLYDLPLLLPLAPPPNNLPLPAGGAAINPTAGAPWITAVGDVPPVMAATLVTYPDRTVLADLPQAGHEWDDVASGYGSAIVTIEADDPAVALLDEGLLIEHRLYGQLAMTTIVEAWEIVELSQGEEADQVCKISGRSHLATLELAVVYPLIFGVGPTGDVQVDRVFNWASIDFPATGWEPATELQRQGDNDSIPPFFVDGNFGPHPAGWPEPDAYWIWSQPFDGNPAGNTAQMPVGDAYFRKAFVLAEPAQIRVYIGADDYWEAWIDGVKLRESEAAPAEAWSRTQHVDISLAAGLHVFAVRATNYSRLSPVGNVAGLIVAAYTIDQASKQPSTLVFLSDNTWEALGYPAATPGFTPGEVIQLVLGEAQARGALTEVSMSFDETVDSNGQPWPVATQISTRCGTDLGTFIVGELGSTYIDVRMQPGGYVLDAWIIGTGGESTDVALDPSAVDPRTGALTVLRRTYG